MPTFERKLVYIVKIVNCQNRDPQIKTGARGGVQILKIEIRRKNIYKNFLVKNHCTRHANIYIKVCIINEDSNL